MSDAASRRSAYLAWIAVCILWGTTYLGIRIALESMPPFLMTALRWLIAGAILIVVLWIRGERLPGPRQWPALAFLGVMFLGFGNGWVVWAEQTITSGLAAVLVAAAPFWMVAVECFMPGGERLSALRIGGLLVGFAGIVVLVWPELSVDSGRAFLLGVGATQLACLGWSIGSSYARRRHADENVLAATALEMFLGGLCVLPVAVLHNELQYLAFTPRSLTAFVYLILFGSIGGFTAYAYALKHLPVSTVSMYAYVNPVIAVLLGTLVLSEPLSPRLVLAGALVLAGMAMVRRSSGPGRGRRS
jgi:drug/metabolite transporter (DMT)-like permease